MPLELLARTYRAKLPPEKQVEPVTKIVPNSLSVIDVVVMVLQGAEEAKFPYASHYFQLACSG